MAEVNAFSCCRLRKAAHWQVDACRRICKAHRRSFHFHRWSGAGCDFFRGFVHKCGSNACHLLPLKLQIELQTAHFWRWRATTKTWPGGESRRRDWQRRVPSPPEGRLSSQVATHWLTCFLGLRGMARVAVSTTCFRRPPRHEPRLRGSRIRAFGATRILAP